MSPANVQNALVVPEASWINTIIPFTDYPLVHAHHVQLQALQHTLSGLITLMHLIIA